MQPFNMSPAGTLAVAFIALFFTLIQFWLYFMQKEEPWHAWGGLISLATALYAASVFPQYFLGRVPVNHVCELVQYTSFLILVHCVYGFTFSYLNIASKRYHIFAGLLHAALLIILWSTHAIISNTFVSRNFLFLSRPYIEPAIGPLGIVFFMYVTCAIIFVPYLWVRHRKEKDGSAALFLTGFSIWLILALHDALVTVLNLESIQFLMEYGFLAFSMSLILVSMKKNIYLLDLSKSQAQKLEEETRRYRMISDVILDFAYFFSITGKGALKYEWVIGSIEKITGYTAGELSLKSVRSKMLHPGDLEKVRAYTERIMSGKQAVVEFRIHKKDGSLRWLADHGRPVFDPSGKTVDAIYGAIQDITDRMVAEEALVKSAHQYRLLVENANDAIFIAQDERLCFANPKTEEITGYSQKELLKIPFMDIVHPDDRQRVVTNYRNRLAGGVLQPVYNFRIMHRSGAIAWGQINAVRIEWEGRPATLNFLRDISEQVRLETELRNSDRLKAITILSGGVAHEFNNALAVVIGNTELLENTLPDSHPGRAHMKSIMSASSRMADLCKKLVAFARGGKYAPGKLAINSVIESVVSAIRDIAGKRISLHLELGNNLYPVYADTDQIRMMIHAIITNAIEGIPETGIITIKTENCSDSGQGSLDGGERRSDQFVCIIISDTGIGMDKKTMSMIFDPFFTTKFQGRGMSMAAVYGIVKGHGGFINVDSEPKKGSVVKIFLPAHITKQK